MSYLLVVYVYNKGQVPKFLVVKVDNQGQVPDEVVLVVYVDNAGQVPVRHTTKFRFPTF